MSTVAYPAQWNTSVFLVGDYQLVAKLLNENGVVVATGTTPFAIVHDLNANVPTVVATLNPDKLIYAGWDQVNLDGGVTHTAANALLAPTVMSVRVIAPDGTVIYTGSEDIEELVPGGSQPTHFSLPLVDAPSGIYTVIMSRSPVATTASS